ESEWGNYFTINNETGLMQFDSSNMNVTPGTTSNVVINYTATDPYGLTDSANITLNVKGEDVNLIAIDAEFVEDEDAIDGTGATAGGYTDQDDGEPEGSLTFQIPAPTYNGTGTITYSAIPSSLVGSDGKTYSVTDLGNGQF